MTRIAFMSHAFLLLMCLSGTSSDENDNFEAMKNLDTSHWVDPYDMGYDPDIEKLKITMEHTERKIPKAERIGGKDILDTAKSTLVRTAQQVQKDEGHHQKHSSTNRKNCIDETPIVSRLVRVLIRQLGLQSVEIHSEEDARHFSLSVKVTRSDLNVLQRFITPHNGNIHDVSDAVVRILNTSEQEKECSWKNIAIYFNKYEMWVTFCIISLVFLLWLMIRQVYLWKLVTVVMLLLFFLSFLWHWIHLYKLALVRKETEVLKYTDVPIECNPSKMSVIQYLWSWFTGGSVNCLKYYEALMVDPFWEVSPATAVAETFTKFFLHPMKHTGTAVGQFFSELLANVPLVWQFPVLVLVGFIIIAVLIMMCEYRLRAPFFLGTLEPAQSIGGKCTLKKLSDDISAVKDNVQKIQHNVNAVIHQSSEPAPISCNGQLPKKIQEVNPDDLHGPQDSNQGKMKEGPGGDPVGHAEKEMSHKPSSRDSGIHTGASLVQVLENIGHGAQDSNPQREAAAQSVSRTVAQEKKSQHNIGSKELQK